MHSRLIRRQNRFRLWIWYSDKRGGGDSLDDNGAFAYPWMNAFFGEKADDYRYAHLMSALEVIPYMVCVDEFSIRYLKISA